MVQYLQAVQTGRFLTCDRRSMDIIPLQDFLSGDSSILRAHDLEVVVIYVFLALHEGLRMAYDTLDVFLLRARDPEKILRNEEFIDAIYIEVPQEHQIDHLAYLPCVAVFYRENSGVA